MNLKKQFFASALLFAACGTIQAQEVIAHRGFWTTDGSAQNSLAALVKADSIHCYGSEFDVWLTTDNQLVVNHDATFKGVTMQDATAKVCTAVQLDNGEQLPTLQQYLDKAKSLKTRLILELKAHKTPEQETRAVEGIVKMIKDKGLEDRTEYITFSQHATKEFIRLAPKGSMGLCRSRLSLQCLPKTSRMDKGMPRPRHESKRLDRKRSQRHGMAHQPRSRFHHNQ